MRKGQAEIIGFLVIVLLLFFSLIFYFQFSNRHSTNLISDSEKVLEVSNLLNAMKLYTLCEGGSLGDAIKSCAQGGGFVCGSDSCSLVRTHVAELAAANGWKNGSYMFSIGDTLYSPASCTGNSLADSYSAGGTSVKLVYCY
ncbi:hypothetical protein HZA98_00535 [Candidatus Woesearchaeota archaeon]|nr:hypothetical protein [Candidatus Woesearchaeota archaeon]